MISSTSPLVFVHILQYLKSISSKRSSIGERSKPCRPPPTVLTCVDLPVTQHVFYERLLQYVLYGFPIRFFFVPSQPLIKLESIAGEKKE